MTTALSAGPLIIDRVKNTLIYVDNNAASPFIGKLILTTNTTASSHSVKSFILFYFKTFFNFFLKFLLF